MTQLFSNWAQIFDPNNFISPNVTLFVYIYIVPKFSELGFYQAADSSSSTSVNRSSHLQSAIMGYALFFLRNFILNLFSCETFLNCVFINQFSQFLIIVWSSTSVIVYSSEIYVFKSFFFSFGCVGFIQEWNFFIVNYLKGAILINFAECF